MSGTLVPPTEPEEKPNYEPDECPHGYRFERHCPVCHPRPGMSDREAQRLANDRKRHK
jgi:hypothetical protein